MILAMPPSGTEEKRRTHGHGQYYSQQVPHIATTFRLDYPFRKTWLPGTNVTYACMREATRLTSTRSWFTGSRTEYVL